MRTEHMQESHPLSIWNYLILLGDSNKNNNKNSQLGSVSSRYLQMFSSVCAEGITSACRPNRVSTFYLALPLLCFLCTALVMVSHKPFWFSLWMLEPPLPKHRKLLETSTKIYWNSKSAWTGVSDLCLHRYAKFTAPSEPHSQVALNSKHNFPFISGKNGEAK